MSATERELALARALKVALRRSFDRSIWNHSLGKGMSDDLPPDYKRDIYTLRSGVNAAKEIGESFEPRDK